MREEGPIRVRRRARALMLVAAVLALAGGAAMASEAQRLDPAKGEVLKSATEQASLPKGMIDASKVDPTLSLPQVLDAGQAERYAEIFRLQSDAAWAQADREIRQLRDKRLLGAVLSQRYTHPKYRSRYDELASWLKHYGDHPEAGRLYRLAIDRKPPAAAAPERPQVGFLGGYGEESTGSESGYASQRQRGSDEIRDIIHGASDLRARLKKGDPDGAERVLGQLVARKILDGVEIAILKAEIAQSHFFNGNDVPAFRLASEATREARGWQPLAPWIAGLSAFRLNRAADAARHFEAMLELRGLTPNQVSAAAFWAARAHLVAGQHTKVSRHLVRAALQRTSFYGLLARRALGVDTPFNWAEPQLSVDDMRQIEEMPGGWRALALIQVGETVRAEAELRKIAAQGNADLAPAFLALASRANMPALSMRLAGKLAQENQRYDGALYPIPGWKPEGGFSVDPALLFAITRQESGFHVKAASGAGARGLMQIMPKTAVFVGEGEVKRTDAKQQLMEPERNLTLGQRYVQHLLEHEQIQGNLLLAVAAYNAGPTVALKWQRKGDYKDDPLLFAEAIPYGETRAYVQRVVANYWIYQLRMGQPTPTLDAVAAGDWPVYNPGDKG
ncbi:MAG: lytic transglycosylase domain-containing protein [Alphaproteobacteria bacterium]|nr:lytic transglycosylase domain-containing protein [Alphaproteobacteria bacterium]